jgi:oligopeptide transport system substrate-binding protein
MPKQQSAANNARIPHNSAMKTLFFVVLLAAASALPAQTLRAVFDNAEVGFDPAAMDDLVSADVMCAVFDYPLRYDYFARPPQPAPGTLAGRPVISEGGRLFTFNVQPELYFSDHPAFKGKKRVLTAADFVYSWKRLIDPKLGSPYYWVFEGKLAGEAEARAQASKAGRFDYDAPIAGIKVIDALTFEVRFTEPNYQFEYAVIGGSMLSPVAREVITAHADDRGRNTTVPIGVGPYKLEQWVRANRIVLTANPNYRDERFPTPPESLKTQISPAAFEAFAKLAGQKLPLSPRVEISIVEESVPRLLMMQKGETDLLYRVPPDLLDRVIEKSALKPEFTAVGIQSQRLLEPSLQFNFFNMDDPILGGYNKANIALRRAILMGLNTEELVRIVYKGQAEIATQLIPPGQIGHDASLNLAPTYDPAFAKALLDRFGYKDRDGDGYREMPDGKPLSIAKASMPEARFREQDELWKKNMDAIGIRVTFIKQKWGELVEMSRLGKLQIWGYAWFVGSPSGDSYTQLLYSKNIGQINDARFKLKAFDTAYETAQKLPFGPERNAQYRVMSELAAVNSVFDLGVHTYRTTLSQPWLKGYLAHPYERYFLHLLVPDEAARKQAAASR